MSVVSTDPPMTNTHNRITNRTLLWWMRIAFVAVVLPLFIGNFLVLPQSYELRYRTVSGDFKHSLLSVATPSFADAHTNPEDYGLSLNFFVAYFGALSLIVATCYITTGIFIFLSRSDDWMAILTGFMLAVIGIGVSPMVVWLLQFPIGDLLLRFELSVWGSLLFLFISVFPDGRFIPRWLRWSIIPTVILVVIGFLEIGLRLQYSYPVMLVVGIGYFGAQFYRYFRVSSPSQRQQTKWVIFGLLFLVVFYLTYFMLKPLATQLGGGYFIAYTLLARPLLFDGAFLIFLASLAFSILRYNLWQVDLVINRSVVYLALTTVLGVLFFGILLLLQVVLERVLGSQQTTIATIAATTVVVGVFNPARKQLQRFIDRRVYHLRADLNEIAAAQKKPDIKNPGMYTGRTFGKYEILGVLGKGGMGEVYKGFGDGQTAAIKVLPLELATKEEFRKRFTREAQTLATLEHSNIVKLFDSGVSDDSVHYLVMEYIDGQELGAVIQEGAVQDYASLCDWVNTIASALDYIHSKGLVHRDLKPSNIMLRKTPDGEIQEAVLMDFGIARVDATGARLTASGPIGTIDYMSPEQILAAREVDKRSDVYALGIIVYQLVTGECPFKGSAGQVLFAHLQQPAPDPRTVRPDVPRHIAKAVLQALEKDPDARYSTAGEFAAALTTHEALST